MTKATSELLTEARDLISNGWTRGKYYRDGRYCAYGALVKAYSGRNPGEMWNVAVNHALGSDEVRVACNYLKDVIIRDEFTGVEPKYLFLDDQIDEWNDAQKTKKPVLDWFDKAAQKAKLDEESWWG